MQKEAGLPEDLLSEEGLDSGNGKEGLMGHAQEVKSLVSMQEAARAYGLEVNPHGFACCPFHREKTASFKVYKGDRGWHCFGCGESGDVIDFVQKYFGLSFNEAIAKLNDDFHLCLPIRERRTQRQREQDAKRAYKRRKVEEEKRRAVEAAKSAYYDALDRYVVLSTIVERFKPQIDDFPGDGFWAAAVMLLPEAKYLLEDSETRLFNAEHLRYN